MKLDSYLVTLNSKKTKEAYKTDVLAFLNWINKPILDCELSDFIDYRDYLVLKYSSASVNRKFSAIKAYVKWLKIDNTFNVDLTLIKLPKITISNETLAFSDNEVRDILNCSKGNSFRKNYHRLILDLLFNLGLRRSELVNIKLNDFISDRGVSLLRIIGKGEKARFIPITEQLNIKIKDYINFYNSKSKNKLGANDYLLQSSTIIKKKPIDTSTIYRIVKQYAKKAGITKNVGAHSCRATIISKMLEEDVSPRNVADFAGHSNVNTTINSYDKKRRGYKDSPVFYIGFLNEDEQLRQKDRRVDRQEYENVPKILKRA